MALNTYASERAKRKIRLMLIHMSSKAHTVDDMAKILCISPKTLGGYFRLLHEGKEKRIHIRRWVKLEAEGGRQAICFVAAYMTGNKKDAPRPKLNNAERCKEYRKKVKEDDEAADLAKVRRKLKQIKPHSDPLIDIFFGRLGARKLIFSIGEWQHEEPSPSNTIID